MKVIYKFEISLSDHKLKMPGASTVLLSVQSQGDTIVAYGLRDPDEAGEVTYDVWVFGTGHDIPENTAPLDSFMGTVKMYDDKFMFHVFAAKRPRTLESTR